MRGTKKPIYFMSKGGMQTSGVKELICKCGKATSRIIRLGNGVELAIHFTRKSTYWHIIDEVGFIKRTFKKPKGWV